MSLSPKASALLKAAKRHEAGPSDEARARVKRRVMSAAAGTLAATGALTTGTTAAAAGTASLVTLKSAALAIGLVAAGGLGIWTQTQAQPPAVPIASSATAPLPAIVVPVADSAAAQLQTAPATEASSVPLVGGLPSAVPSANAPQAGSAPATRAPTAPLPQVASAAIAPSSVDALRQETHLLSQAQNALSSGNASLALSLLQQHQKEHPNGALAVERRALLALSLCTLGRQAEGQVLAAGLPAHVQQAPLGARVQKVCGP